jgi:L-threonylcarbamoyladenylate synthase
MNTRIISQSDKAAKQETLSIINSGGVVAVPTDTVYGIACSVENPNAIQSLYQIKIRESIKAIPVLLADFAQISLVAKDLNENARKLAQFFWPGALTLILQKNEFLPQNLTVYSTVGVRIPDHDWLRTIMRESGPLAATSANISGEASPSTANQVLHQLKGRLELVIDGGESKGGISSTVVDCSGKEIQILRLGGISQDQIQSVLGK